MPLENIKKHCHKKSNCVFLQLRSRNLLKAAAFVIFPTSIMILFEIHQRFKGHFLNELRVSFNEKRLDVRNNRLRKNYSESASKTPDNGQSKFNNRNRLNRVDGTRENP